MFPLIKAKPIPLVNIFRQIFATNSRLMSISKKISLEVKYNENFTEISDPKIVEYKNKLMATKITTEEPMDITAFNGVPEEHIRERRVRICKPSKNAMQSGTNATNLWRIDFENRERWENPLMGWTSSGDPMSNLNLWFATREDAEAFCEKNGWYYEVTEPQERRKLNKSYAENFSWNKRTRVGSK